MDSGREGEPMIIALHGFLGLPSDWEEVLAGYPVRAIDLWKDIAEIDDRSTNAFAEWTRNFIKLVEEETSRGDGASSWDGGDGAAAEPNDGAKGGLNLLRTPLSVDDRPILLGYSMGGRLAIHAAIARPDLFQAAIFVSAHPGLMSESEKVARRANDEAWARRFMNEPWDSLMAAWNGQGVLTRHGPSSASPMKALDRDERDFDRALLARAMRVWSLAGQRDLRAELSQLKLPTLFLSGEHDEKFTDLMSRLSLNSSQQRWVVHGAGHRLPWDNPGAFRACLEDFLD